MKLKMFVRPLVLAIFALGLLAGCGGGGGNSGTDTGEGGTTAATESSKPKSTLVPVDVLTPRTVEGCLEDGDAIVMSSEDLNPGEAIDAHGIFAMTGKSGARVGIVLTLKPFITRRLSRELAAEGEYDVSTTPSEEAIVVFDKKATAEDEALASECAEP